MIIVDKVRHLFVFNNYSYDIVNIKGKSIIETEINERETLLITSNLLGYSYKVPLSSLSITDHLI